MSLGIVAKCLPYISLGALSTYISCVRVVWQDTTSWELLYILMHRKEQGKSDIIHPQLQHFKTVGLCGHQQPGVCNEGRYVALHNCLRDIPKTCNVLSECHKAADCLGQCHIYPCGLHSLRQGSSSCVHVCAYALPYALQKYLRSATQR